MMNKSDDIFFDEWEDAMLDELIQTEELVLSSIATKRPFSNSSLPPPTPPSLPQPLPSVAVSTISFSPPRELSQRTTTADCDSLAAKPTSSTFAPAFPRPESDKDLEIERLKRELGRASKQLANLEKECLKLKKERDKKEDQPKFVSSKNEEENDLANCSKGTNKDSGILALDYHKTSSNFQNGVSSKGLTVEKTFKSKGVETDMVNCQEAPSSLDLSKKLLAIWESPTDKKLGGNAISKLLVGCQRDFHILFGCMSMSFPSEIIKELLTGSSGVALHYLKDCFHTPEAAKVSHLYLALTKITNGTYVLETLIEPLLDLCGMENIIVVHSSLCILHALLKLLLESEKNFGNSALCSGKMSSLKDLPLGRMM